MKFHFILIFTTLLTNSCSLKEEKNTMTNKEYSEKAQYMWQNFVPKSGQAETVQGELIRSVEKLRDEAQRNGNINFSDDCHRILIEYLRIKLNDKSLFSDEEIKFINKDLDTLSDEDYPYTEDDLYDRITNRIVDWYMKYNKPIKHEENKRLYC